MKKKPASKSAFFTPRVLISFAFCSIGVFLSLLAFALYPGGNAIARENRPVAERAIVNNTAPAQAELPAGIMESALDAAETDRLALEAIMASNTAPTIDAAQPSVITATFTVNTVNDTADVTPGDGICLDAAGMCSFRAAISEANAFAGDDIITLGAVPYTQTLVAANEDLNAGGDWDITSNITINGVTAATTILQANVAAGAATERVLNVRSGTVIINNCTIRNGRFTGVMTAATRGGGIENIGTLTLNNCIVRDNQNSSTSGNPIGAGIHNAGPALTLTNTQVTANLCTRPTSTGSAFGGGISSIVAASLTFTNSSVSGNTASSPTGFGFGPGVYLENVFVFNATNSNFDNNTGTGSSGSNGNGIRALSAAGAATLTATNCTFSGNTGGPGGTNNQGIGLQLFTVTSAAATLTVTLDNVTINGNTGNGPGLGINVQANGGAVTINASNSTISNNTGASNGGGVLLTNVGSTLTSPVTFNLTNSTLSGNSTTGSGGGLAVEQPTAGVIAANLNFVTVANNTATVAGGGLFRSTAGTINIKNTIVADNTSAGGPNIAGTIISQNYNHIEDPTGGTFAAMPNDVVAGDPALGALANNGGTTLTHLPGGASIVLNTIPNGTNDCGAAVNRDQRGAAFVRPSGAGCEKGSVEVQVGGVSPTPSASPTVPPGTPTPTPSASPSASASATVCPPLLTENFDGVTAPALPAGWTSATVNGDGDCTVGGALCALGTPWTTVTTTPDTAPNAAFHNDPTCVTDSNLDTPNIVVAAAGTLVTFRHSFNVEDTFDGGVLEVSSPNIAAGAFTDITNALVGGSFVVGGYTDTINTGATNFLSPIRGRMAWSGNSAGYITTTANLGPNVAGQTIKLRFRFASDCSVGVAAGGWRVDTMVVTGPCGPGATPTPSPSASAAPSGTPCGAPGVLYSQVDNPGALTNDVTSQDFEAANNAFDSFAADDFVVPAGQTWTVNQVVVHGDYSAGPPVGGPAPAFNVFFHSEAATLPSAAPLAGGTFLSATYTSVVGAQPPRQVFTITLPGGIVLPAGTYWVSVQARMDFTPTGQWFWANRLTATNSGAAWQNPGGGFAVGCTTWGRRTTCLATSVGPDQMFQIVGTNGAGGCPTPSPSASVGPGTPTPSPSASATPCGGTTTFSNTTAITIPDIGNAAPYPSTIAVSGVGTIPATATGVQITFNGFSHSFTDDIGLVLVGPTGAALLVQDGWGDADVAAPITYTISDAGAAQGPDTGTWGPGTYKPAAYYTGDSFPAPGPGTTYNHPGPVGGGTATFASTFGGTNANGNWNLYIVDFVAGDAGSISGGWTISFTTGAGGCPSATPSVTPPAGTPTPSPTCPPAWSTGPNAPPAGLVRAVGTYFPANGRFYSLGGRTSDAAGSDTTNPFEYDPATNAWVTKPSTLPDLRVNNMACGVLTVAGTPQIYCVGGSQATIVGNATRVFSYNPATDTSTVLAAGDDWPGAQAGGFLPGGFAVAGNKLYIIGSFNANSVPPTMTNQVWEFDPTAAVGAKWVAKANFPQNRGYVPAASIGGIIYTGGGAALDPTNTLVDSAESFRFDPVGNAWTAIPNIPRATGETRAVVINGTMWVLGGGRTAPNPSTQVNVYDPVANAWTLGPAFTTARRNFPADSNGTNRIFLAGGYDTAGTIFLNTTELFGPAGACASPSPSATIAPGTPTPSPTPGTPTPTATATATVGPSTTPGGTATPGVSPTPPAAAQAVNFSTRMFVQTGDRVGIGGFIITGPSPKNVIIRAIGPSLKRFGITDPLADPVLQLTGPSGFTPITNNNWRDTQEDAIQLTGLAPTNNLESAIVATLAPGAYTGVVRGNNNGTGVALIEVYDLNPNNGSKLANISTRAFVGTGDDIVIAGFILGGSNSGPDQVIVRGLGPSLGAFGVTSLLANPTLELRDNNGALIFSNNDWQDNAVQAAIVSAAGLAPSNTLESAIAATLPPNLYTVLLAGLNSGTGNGLIEVYDRGTGVPGPSPSPGASPTPSPIVTPSPGVSPSPTVAPSPGASPTATATATATVAPSPSPGGGPCLENFDTVTAPALPSGWTSTLVTGDPPSWENSTTSPDTAPNAVFVNDQDGISDKVLDSRNILVSSAAAQITFRNNYDTEYDPPPAEVFWDGFVLEVSVNGGAFVDVTDPTIGGSFVSGGYTGEIDGTANNPLAGRFAWCGASGGYINSVINLGAALNGQTIKIRFRMGTDEAVARPGVRIDTLSITGASCPP